MNPFRLALIAGVLAGIPLGGWMLSLLATAPDPERLHQIAVTLVLLQLGVVVPLLPGFISRPSGATAVLLLFLIPAPLGVLLILAGADTTVVTGSQLLGLLGALAMAMAAWGFERAGERHAWLGRGHALSLLQVALLLALVFFGPLLTARMA